MPLIVLGVLVLGGLLAFREIRRNKKNRSASSRGKAGGVAPVIYLPYDIELEKRRRNIL